MAVDVGRSVAGVHVLALVLVRHGAVAPLLDRQRVEVRGEAVSAAGVEGQGIVAGEPDAASRAATARAGRARLQAQGVGLVARRSDAALHREARDLFSGRLHL
eukprot:6989621-Heterocapsa_arctica.AAC.1